MRFALARDIGQVRDLLVAVGPQASARTYRTVREAVAALAATPRPEGGPPG